ncbi:hypothetical protein ACOSQ3_019471 [Xanthoceras sorbifolium]
MFNIYSFTSLHCRLLKKKKKIAMLETTETTAQSEDVTNGGVNSHVPGELQNIKPAYRLNGKNYLKWSQMVRTFLKGKENLSIYLVLDLQKEILSLRCGVKKIL